MKRILLWTCALLGSGTLAAQDFDDFDSFMKAESKAFDDFLNEADRDFLNFMRDPWKQINSKEPLVKRKKPEPVKPIVFDEETTPKDEKPTQLTIEEILDLTTSEDYQPPIMTSTDVDLLDFDKPKDKPSQKKKPTVIVVEEKVKPDRPVTEEKKPATKQPEQKKPNTKPAGKPTTPTTPTKKPTSPTTPTTPTGKPTTPTGKPTTPAGTPSGSSSTPSIPASPLTQGGADRSAISYGGTRYYMSTSAKGSFRLAGIKEKQVADAYEKLYKTDFSEILKDMRTVKKDLSLNDWGMYMFVKSYADANTDNANESIILQHYLLSQLGYKAKMARMADGSKLMLFLATDCVIYGHPYTTINGQEYYYLNGTESCLFYMCTQDSPQAKNAMSMSIRTAPALRGDTEHSVHQALGSSAKVEANIPKALMDFYKSYPQCDYSVYVKAPVNPTVAQDILTPLRNLVQGKSEKDAANLLINFVQTGFKYATDDEQFGYEKPFFVEELFYYPCCDCEDRSIFFSYLVRNILGLDVVLLDYPNHIATAVKFNEEVGGDFLMVNGSKYTVCDPTYIGASIGMTMPQFKTVKAKVLRY